MIFILPLMPESSLVPLSGTTEMFQSWGVPRFTQGFGSPGQAMARDQFWSSGGVRNPTLRRKERSRKGGATR